MLDEQPVETTLYSLATVPPGKPERRADERHMTLLRVGSLIVGERRELCLIRNVSAGGMLIRVYSAIAPGTRVMIELKQGEPVHGTTLWAQDELVGMSFDEPIDILSLIETPANAPRPRMPRLEVRCTAWVRDGAVVHRTRAVNISQGGLRVEAARTLPAGAQVTVTLPSLPPEQGVVRWNDGECCGITFNNVIALPQLVAWLGHQHERQRLAG
jgi:PilZ domain-containing protein